MNQRLITPVGAILALVVIAVFLMPSPAAAQTIKAGTGALNVAPVVAKPWAVTKTPDGQPDLQGYWTNNTITPLQRPNGVTKEFYTKEEFLEAAKKQAQRDEEQTTPGTVADVHYDFTQFGLDKSQTVINNNMRPSIITNPANGKIPPVTSEGQKRAAEKAAERRN